MKTLTMLGLLVSLFVVGIVAPEAHAASPIRPGMWEVTSTVEMPGMPGAVPPTTQRHCYKKEDVEDTRKVVPASEDCAMTDYKTTGNKVTWTVKCRGQDAGTGTGEMVGTGDTYEGWMKFVSREMQMTQRFKGRRIGDCK